MSQDGKWHREVKKAFASTLSSSAVKGVQGMSYILAIDDQAS